MGVSARHKKGIDEIKNLFDLNGKVAIVTGGSGALGKAVSLGLAAYGVDVVVCSLELSVLEEVSREIQEMGRRALPIFCDVTDPESVEKVVNRTM
ncbi:MAG: SDR family NAD(P)-dependent oxidoreductase, partial [Deltaproteobacteria bacterium]|nr:SDR family NAD(P)-dependent oxidoreductase [Deltaproteobacteria bacterium]